MVINMYLVKYYGYLSDRTAIITDVRIIEYDYNCNDTEYLNRNGISSSEVGLLVNLKYDFREIELKIFIEKIKSFIRNRNLNFLLNE